MLPSENDKEYLLELTPRSNKTMYSRIVLSLDSSHNYPIKMAFFDKDNNYEKLAVYKYEKKDSYWYAKEVLMTDLRKEHSTKIVMKDIKFDQGLTDDEFTVETLKE
jgi:outer membrane lipoprotein-sorting protein